MRTAIRFSSIASVLLEAEAYTGTLAVSGSRARFSRTHDRGRRRGLADSYDELAPYYSHVEKIIGVTGSREHLDILPDGEFLRPLALACSEQLRKRACIKLGIPMIPLRKVVLTEPYDGRDECHYCGQCMEGCDMDAIFPVPISMLPKARLTGNFTLLSVRIARELKVNQKGRVRAVSIINAETRQEKEIHARFFAVCCAIVESAHLLLNSRSALYPTGLANSSDAVGRYLHGHVTAGIIGYLVDLAGTRPVNDGTTDHSYIPRFNMDDKKRHYAGGFQFSIGQKNSWVSVGSGSLPSV
jgi:choline dehydrogenase-like flavoprotein